tara:strand:- start:305 stop:571 length:267 start_codon:yes stop_codon:yes gene_type:complete
MTFRKFLSKVTSPIFVPLRKLMVWMDNSVGTCDMKLTLAPRWVEETNIIEDISTEKISELSKKISKDKANFNSLNSDFPIVIEVGVEG